MQTLTREYVQRLIMWLSEKQKKTYWSVCLVTDSLNFLKILICVPLAIFKKRSTETVTLGNRINNFLYSETWPITKLYFFFILCNWKNRCWTDVQATEEYKVPWTGGNKCAAAIGKGNNKNGTFLRRLWWPKKELTWKRSPYLPESLILPLVSGNRSTQRSKYNHLYEFEIKVGWWGVKKYGGVRKRKCSSATAVKYSIQLPIGWLHYRGNVIRFVIIPGFDFQYSLGLCFNEIV